MSSAKNPGASRIIDKRVARRLIQELQVRAGWRVKRLAAPSRPERNLPKPLRKEVADPAASGERMVSPQALALAKRQLGGREPERPGPKAALEAYPRIAERVCHLWGFRELRPYLESMVLIEASRVERQGLEPKAQEELMFLYGLIDDFSGVLFAPEEREPPIELSQLYHFAR